MGVKRKKAAKTLRKNAANRKIFCKLRALSLFLDLTTGHSLKHHGVNPGDESVRLYGTLHH